MGGANTDDDDAPPPADPVFCGDVDASMIDHDDDGEGHPSSPGRNGNSNDDADGGGGGDDAPAAAAPRRQGTISSARFNMLSTMVGGGSLSLPLAFAKSGNGLVGPVLLVGVALLTEFCFRVHVGSARMLRAPRPSRPGADSFESVASEALGRNMRLVSMALVTAMCFFGTVGYAVLLRDMLQPVTDAIWDRRPYDNNSNSTNSTWDSIGELHAASTNNGSGPTLPNNLTMLAVVLLMTPLCALKTLTALQRFGAASMLSVLVLGGCVVYRSVQCNYELWRDQPSVHDYGQHSVWDAFKLFPNSWRDVLDAFPLYVSCFVCHYNLLPVHNDLKDPTPPRVGYWLRSTVGSATAFYMAMGLAGSAYGRCTAAGRVESGNILLDFPEDDPLLMVGRMCLAVTLALAFPMLTIPARDIVLRSSLFSSKRRQQRQRPGAGAGGEGGLTEPLLSEDVEVAPSSSGFGDGTNGGGTTGTTADVDDANKDDDPSLGARLVTAIAVFWSAAAVASCVRSIDVVWDLLGSSLSILLSYLIPCGAYLAIARRHEVQVRAAANGQGEEEEEEGEHDLSSPRLSKWLATGIIVAYVPLMLISTANAVHNTFFKPK